MPTRSELIATGRSDQEIATEIGADALVYQDLDALKASIRDLKPTLSCFDASCFDGSYVTGDVTPAYLDAIEQAREGKMASASEDGGVAQQMHLNLMSVD
jgi:amidophosphoribosyltransferase